MLRAALPRLLLIFALLLTQLGALTHGVSHIMEAQGADFTLSHDKHCDLCAEYAQLDSAVSSTDIQFAVLVRHNTFACAVPADFHSRTFAAFAARAPPHEA